MVEGRQLDLFLVRARRPEDVEILLVDLAVLEAEGLQRVFVEVLRLQHDVRQVERLERRRQAREAAVELREGVRVGTGLPRLAVLQEEVLDARRGLEKRGDQRREPLVGKMVVVAR